LIKCLAVAAQRADVMGKAFSVQPVKWTAAPWRRTTVANCSGVAIPGDSAPCSNKNMFTSAYGSASPRYASTECNAGCTAKKIQKGTAAAQMVCHGSARTKQGTTRRLAGSPRARYQFRITVATAAAVACGPSKPISVYR